MSLRGRTVLLRSAFVPKSGYGRDGIDMAQTLIEMGAELHIEPFTVGVPLPPDIAALMARPRPQPPHFDLAITHCEPENIETPERLGEVADTSIGWTMWEFTSVGGERWAATLRQRLQNFDRVFAYDEITRSALLGHAPAGRVSVLQGGFRASDWKPSTSRDWSGTFRFVMWGQLHARKNPLAAIHAFRELKREHGPNFDAELILKTNHNSIPEAMWRDPKWCPGLHVIFDAWPREQLVALTDECHAYVAPSWGEGKNLPALEAQATGMPAIVSKCGGHMQWADPEWSYLVPGHMAEHDPVRKPGQKSVRVDVGALRDIMWHVYTNRAEARQKGELASRVIPSQCDWSKVLERLTHTLGV